MICYLVDRIKILFKVVLISLFFLFSSRAEAQDVARLSKLVFPEFECDFEIDECGWSSDSSFDGLIWSRAKDLHNDPLFSIILSNNFAYLKLVSKPKYWTSIYKSNWTSHAATGYISFNYIISSSFSTHLLLNIEESDGTTTTLFNVYHSFNYEWTTATVNFTTKNDFRLVFEARLDPFFIGQSSSTILHFFLALDDIIYFERYCLENEDLNGSCIPHMVNLSHDQQAELFHFFQKLPKTIIVDPKKDERANFMCENEEFITFEQVCDGVSDCSVGEDEQYCGHCNFDTFMCEWYDTWINSMPPTYQWLYQKPCFNSSSSGCAIVKAHSPIISHPVKLRLLKSLKNTSYGCTIRFDYLIIGSKLNLLDFRIDDYNERSTLWRMRSSNLTTKWQHAFALIGQRSEAYLEFKADIGLDGYIALDNIQLENCHPEVAVEKECEENEILCPRTGRCVSQYLLCDTVDDCGDNFDESLEFCNRVQKVSFDDHLVKGWKISKHWYMSTSLHRPNIFDIGPFHDHTFQNDRKGKYLIASILQKTLTATITSHSLSTAHECTLRFFYYSHGSDFGVLEIFGEYQDMGNKELLWHHDGNQGQFWNRAVITIRSKSIFRFVIEVKSFEDEFTFISIDDLSLSEGCNEEKHQWRPPLPFNSLNCEEDEFRCANGYCIMNLSVCNYQYDCVDKSDEYGCGPCDFKLNTCGWYDSSQGNLKWSRYEEEDKSKLARTGYYLGLKQNYGLILSSWAIIKSSMLLPLSVSCYMSFEYRLKGKLAILEARIKDPNSDMVVLQLSSSPKWKKVNLPLVERTNNYQIYLQTNASLEDNIGVRNIEFVGCSKFGNSGDCNFEEDHCQWNMSNVNGEWKRNQGLLDSMFGPFTDRKEEIGTYLYFKPDHDSLTSYASLSSSVIYGYCFTFWYFMNGHSIGSLLVNASNGTNCINIWKRSRSKGQSWHLAHIELPFKSTYLQIHIENNQQMSGVIAIDDIKILAGSCKPKVCDFEVDFCLWQPVSNGTSTWEITKLNKRDDLIQALVDHSTETLNGNFLYILNKNTTSTVKLMSIVHTDKSSKCFIFWYTSWGEIGNLSVKQNFFKYETLIWSKSTNHYGVWRKGQVNINKGSNYAIEIEATFTSFNQGFFAIDDLLILDKECPTKITCDFEIDTCGWSSNYTVEGNDWIRVNHLMLNQKDKQDVSMQTSTGHFLYALFENGTMNREITIQSEDFEANENWCFSFWYYLENFNNITLHLETLDHLAKMHSILVINSSFTNEWILKSVQIHSNNKTSNQNDFQVLQFRASRNDQDAHFGSRVAIKLDDIKLSNGLCNAEEIESDVQDTINDIQEDYALIDSFSQLTCDFEKGMCGWMSLVPTLWKLVRGIKISPISSNSLNYVATDFKGNGYFAAFIGSKQHTQAILLSKNYIKSSELVDEGCFDFIYHMKGDHLSMLSLQYLVDNYAFALWQRSGPFLSWQRARVNIPALKTKFYLQFEAKTRAGTMIGLDNIYFTRGPCERLGQCTFEYDNCGFRNLEVDRGWVKQNGLIRSPDNLATDHTMQTTFGNYFHLESNVLFKLNELEGTNVSIVSPIYPNSFSCLKFSSYYYGYGHNIGEFKILVRDALTKSQIILYKSEGDDDLWRDFEIQIENYFDNFEIIFQATLGPNYKYSKLGIDDIEISPICKANSFRLCDFETYCPWVRRSEADQLVWNIGYYTYSVAPKLDELQNPQLNKYAFIYSVNFSLISGRLESPYLEGDAKYCIEFMTFVNGVSSPRIDLHLYSFNWNKLEPSQKMIWTNNASDELRIWFKHKLDVNLIESEIKRFKLFFNVTFTELRLNEQFVAIDNIDLHLGVCYHNSANFDCELEPNSSEVIFCDFVKDCKDGQDENICGSNCDFESDFCNWTFKKYYHWLRIDLSEVEFFNKLDNDATFKQPGKGTFVVPVMNQDLYSVNFIRSPLYNRAGPNCFFNFFLYTDTNPNEISSDFLIINVYLVNDFMHALIWQIYGHYPSWQEVSLYIGQNIVPFYIKIEVHILDHSRSSFVALDEFKFSQDCAIVKFQNKTNCDQNEFYCQSTKKCIPSINQCDYNDDCGDGEDEFQKNLNCVFVTTACDFENDLNNWSKMHENCQTSDKQYDINIYRDQTFNNKYGIYYACNTLSWPIFMIKSPDLIIKRKDHDCRFRFYYQYWEEDIDMYLFTYGYKQVPPLIISTKLLNQKSDEIVLDTVSMVNGSYFARKEVLLTNFPIDQPFNIFIKVSASENESTWAIDDLSFTPDCVHFDPCFFKCPGTKKCLNQNQICDFNQNCPNGEDELSCTQVKCDFENKDLCGWVIENETENLFSWQLSNLDYLPGHDTTMSAPNEWLLLANSTFSRQVNRAVFSTQKIALTGAWCQLKFNVYCKINHCNFYVVKENEMTSSILPFQLLRFNQDSNGNWSHLVNLFIGHDKNFSIKIVAQSSQYFFNFSIGLDDLEFIFCEPPVLKSQFGLTEVEDCGYSFYDCQNGYCIPEALLCDSSDDCLNGSDEDNFCNTYETKCDFETPCIYWHNEVSPSSLGRFNQLSYKGDFYYPPTDHTLRSPNGTYYNFASVDDTKFNFTARLVSPVLNLNNSINCYVYFWVYVTSNERIEVYQRTRYSKDGLNYVVTIFPDQFIWSKIKVELPSLTVNDNYQVVFEAIIPNKGSVSIDDLVMSSDCQFDKVQEIPIPDVILCEKEYKSCKNNLDCYNKDHECNFINECGDNTDEEGCGTQCRFKLGLCNWTSVPPKGWMLQSGINLNLENEQVSESYKFFLYEGFLITNNTIEWSKPNDSVSLISPQYASSGYNCYFRFFYIIMSEKMNSLNVYIQQQSKADIKLWSVREFKRNDWREAVVHIGYHSSPFNIKIEAVHGEGNEHENIAINDIALKDCKPTAISGYSLESYQCLSTVKSEYKFIPLIHCCDGIQDCPAGDDEVNCPTSLGNCDFNSSYWQDECQWQDLDLDFKWKRLSQSSYNNHPQSSLEGEEAFLFFDNINKTIGDEAAIQGPTFNQSINRCQLSFQYYMYGSEHTGSLMIYTKSEESEEIRQVINLVGNRSKKWILFRTMIGHSSSYKVIFLVKVTHLEESYIAIDKIKFSPNCQSGEELSYTFFKNYLTPMHSQCNCNDTKLSSECFQICGRESKVEHIKSCNCWALPIVFILIILIIILTRIRRLLKYNFDQKMDDKWSFEMHTLPSN